MWIYKHVNKCITKRTIYDENNNTRKQHTHTHTHTHMYTHHSHMYTHTLTHINTNTRALLSSYLLSISYPLLVHHYHWRYTPHTPTLHTYINRTYTVRSPHLSANPAWHTWGTSHLELTFIEMDEISGAAVDNTAYSLLIPPHIDVISASQFCAMSL